MNSIYLIEIVYKRFSHFAALYSGTRNQLYTRIKYELRKYYKLFP